MQVDDAVEAVGLVLVPDPALHRPQEVAEMQVASGLDAGEDTRHGR
ncbi:MAG: hypothetical protein V9E94_04300 [Microthrixaceae bacterium]